MSPSYLTDVNYPLLLNRKRQLIVKIGCRNFLLSSKIPIVISRDVEHKPIRLGDPEMPLYEELLDLIYQ